MIGKNSVSKKAYSTIVFDLDGTLMDTLEDLANSVNVALVELQLPQRSIDEIRTFVGDGVRELLVRAVKAALREVGKEETFSHELLYKSLELFKNHYTGHCMDTARPYNGVSELLENLKNEGFTLAIVSNKPQKEVSLLHKNFFAKYVDVAIGECESEGIHKKPAPDMVYKALELLSVSVTDAVYVGDSEVDIATAKNAGLDCISVLWGFRSEQLLREKGATRLVHSPSEIFSIVSASPSFSGKRLI